MKTGADSKIWVVLPAYNEESALPTLLDSLLENLGQKGEEFSIIVVNDGSKDRTGEVAEDYARRAPVSVLHNDGNKGLAETMRRGLMEAVNNANGKDTIVTMDADNTHPAGLALNMVRSIRKGDDIVIASRYRKGSQVRWSLVLPARSQYGGFVAMSNSFPDSRGARLHVRLSRLSR